jgi:hypothetical protein
VSTLSFDILARDRASRTLDKVGDRAGRTGREFNKFKVLAAGAAVAVGAALFRFGKDSVRQFAEAEKAQNQLTDAFARFPKLADISIDSLRTYNKQLALKTRFDDDAFASGQAVLAQFGFTGQKLKEITPLLADYAAKTGKDLPTAAKTLGKAFLGNTRALKEIGISYKTTGDAATDMANITDLVRAKVGGFAEKEGKTAAGQLAILSNQFGELQEEVGARLLPVLLGLTKTGLKLVEWIDRNRDSLGPLVAIFGTFAVSILLVNRAVKTFTATQAALTVVLGKYGKEAGAATKATKGLGVAMLALAGFTIIHDLFHKSAQELGRFTDKVEALGGQNVNERIAAITDELEKQNKAAKDGAVIGVSGLLQWYTSGKALDAADRVDALKQRLADLNAERDREITANAIASQQMKKTMEAQIGLVGSADRYAHALGLTTGALEDQNAELDEAWDNQHRLNNELLTAVGAEISFRDAVANGTKKIRDAVKAGEDHATSLSLQNQAGRDNVSWLLDAVKAANDHAEAVLNQTGSVEKANGALRNDVQALRNAASAAGLNKKEVDKLVAAYVKVPSKAETKVEQPGMAKAKTDAAALKSLMEKVEGTYKTKVNVITSGLASLLTLSNVLANINGVRVNIPVSAITARQHGGPVSPNQPYLVGENSAEILYKGRVYPSGKVPPMLRQASGGGGMAFTGDIHVHGVQNVHDLIAEIQRYARNNAGVKIRTFA